VGLDRNGRTYEGSIEPDEQTARKPGDDPALAEALAWLTGSNGCR
jgi:hypothetical protein